MLKNETILITGGTGYLGSRILSLCLDLKAKVVLLKRSTSNTDKITNLLPQIKTYNSDIDSIKNIFLENKISTVIHCATTYSRPNLSESDILKTNLELPLEILNCGIDHGIKTFINTDTFLSENISKYSQTKKNFLNEFKKYQNQISCINICLEYFYGPFDSEHKLLTYLTNSFYSNTDSIDLTLGEQKRDFIFIDDVISAYKTILESSFLHKKGFHHFEVGTGQTISIKDLALLIKELVNNQNTHLKFGEIPYRENEIFDSNVNLSPLKDLGWLPQFTLLDGLKKMIEIETPTRRKA